MVFYCKMCGGELELDTDASIGCCQYCGTKQTIPKTDDEKILNLFNRANHYRIKNDFENAMGSYENILSEDAANAEAYWGLCLCRYGIEYVKDPVTEQMIPIPRKSGMPRASRLQTHRGIIEIEHDAVSFIANGRPVRIG